MFLFRCDGNIFLNLFKHPKPTGSLECGHSETKLYGGDTRLLRTPNFPNESDNPDDR